MAPPAQPKMYQSIACHRLLLTGRFGVSGRSRGKGWIRHHNQHRQHQAAPSDVAAALSSPRLRGDYGRFYFGLKSFMLSVIHCAITPSLPVAANNSPSTLRPTYIGWSPRQLPLGDEALSHSNAWAASDDH
jgi:hypothetical protein